jgi:TonB family protein
MGDQKTCVHCGRQIDAVAKSCPFCNGDQSAAPRPRVVSTSGTAAHRSKPERPWRNKILGGVAFLVLLVAAFAIGSFIHGFDMPLKNDKTTTAPATPARAAATPVAPNSVASDLTLVPVTDTTSTLEASITSAPAPNPKEATSSEYQRSDATALPSDEYARAAQKVKAERQSATIDPRTIAASPQDSGRQPRSAPDARTAASARPAAQSAIPDPPREERTAPQPSDPEAPAPAKRTAPEPISQPLPRIDVDRPSRATLNLTIGPDGHVREVEVVQSIPGATDKLIGAVQTWRFKPATENGVPTTGTFQVNVSFNPSH